MIFSYNQPIWFYPEVVDFRKQIDTLVTLVSSCLELNPMSGQLFIFRNRTGNKLKLLWSDAHGFWLCYRRLEKGRFKLPRKGEKVMEFSRDELSWLLTGIDLTKQKSLPKTKAIYFY